MAPDKKDFDEVFGLSLGSACGLRFRRKAGSKWECFTLDAQPRSLYVMTGEARLGWECRSWNSVRRERLNDRGQNLARRVV